MVINLRDSSNISQNKISICSQIQNRRIFLDYLLLELQWVFHCRRVILGTLIAMKMLDNRGYRNTINIRFTKQQQQQLLLLLLDLLSILRSWQLKNKVNWKLKRNTRNHRKQILRSSEFKGIWVIRRKQLRNATQVMQKLMHSRNIYKKTCMRDQIVRLNSARNIRQQKKSQNQSANLNTMMRIKIQEIAEIMVICKVHKVCSIIAVNTILVR